MKSTKTSDVRSVAVSRNASLDSKLLLLATLLVAAPCVMGGCSEDPASGNVGDMGLGSAMAGMTSTGATSGGTAGAAATSSGGAVANSTGQVGAGGATAAGGVSGTLDVVTTQAGAGTTAAIGGQGAGQGGMSGGATGIAVGGSSGAAAALGGAAGAVAMGGADAVAQGGMGGIGGMGGASVAQAGSNGQAGSGADEGSMFLLASPGWEAVNNDECTADLAATCPLFPQENVATSINGSNQSPELSWSGTPAGTMSFTLVLQDLVNDNVHWVLYNVPGETTGLPANLPTTSPLTDPAGAEQGEFFNMPGYFGSGACGNTYEFRLYALDVAALPDNVTNTNVTINDWLATSDAILGETFVRLRSGQPYCTP